MISAGKCTIVVFFCALFLFYFTQGDDHIKKYNYHQIKQHLLICCGFDIVVVLNFNEIKSSNVSGYIIKRNKWLVRWFNFTLKSNKQNCMRISGAILSLYIKSHSTWELNCVRNLFTSTQEMIHYCVLSMFKFYRNIQNNVEKKLFFKIMNEKKQHKIKTLIIKFIVNFVDVKCSILFTMKNRRNSSILNSDVYSNLSSLFHFSQIAMNIKFEIINTKSIKTSALITEMCNRKIVSKYIYFIMCQDILMIYRLIIYE